MDKVIRDLLEMINFTQSVAVKIHGLLEEAEIYRVVGEEFRKSKTYDANVVLLTDGGTKLRILQTSLSGKQIAAAEKATGLRLQGYRIDLNKSSIWSQVVREGKTMTARGSDLLSEWLPKPLVALILKVLRYEQRISVMTPLRCEERIVGAIAVNCAAFDESVVPSVKNLAQHISSALTLADQTAKRLQAEQAVRESEGRFRQMAAVIPVVFWMFSPDWTHAIYVSPAVEQIYGRTRESFYQQPALWLDVIHPDDRERVFAFRRQQPDQDAEHEYRIIRPDGQVRWIRNVASPVHNEVGELMSLTGFVEDITARKEAEQALQASEEYFRALIEDASDVMVTLNSDGVLRYVSPSVQKRWGWTPTALVGTNAAQYCHPDDRLQLADALDRVRQRPGASASVELRFGDAEGSWRYVRGTARNLLDDPAVAGIVVNVVDITEQRRTEAQLAQADKLASLGVLAGGIAHQVRNPLSIISAWAQLLLEHPDDGELPGQAVRSIRTAVQRASDVIEGLMRFASPAAPQMAEIHIESVLEDTLRLLAAHIGVQGVILEKELPSDLPTVRGDALLLQQVFTNLILNACKAMPGGGRLEIAAEHTDENGVQIRFRDTGHGIAAQNLSRIFDPFFTTMPPGQGTGLGLSISHKIVEQHNGRIEVQSEVGQGTTFKVCLPGSQDSRSPIAVPGPSAEHSAD